MKHSVPHDVGKASAKKAAVAAFDHYKARFAKYNPTARWITDDRVEVAFTAKGITLEGALEVAERTIDMDLDVPFLLRPFKDVALGAVDREIGKWIDKVKRGEIA